MAKYIKYDINKIMKAIFNSDSHTHNKRNLNELIDELKQLMCDLGDICEQTDEEDIFWNIHKFLNRGKPRGDILNTSSRMISTSCVGFTVPATNEPSPGKPPRQY